MHAVTGGVSALVAALRDGGVDVAALGLAWARVAPAVTIVPAFGLRALAAPVRAAVGLALALSVAPCVTPVAAGEPWALALVREAARGVPVAIAAAVPLWAAASAGGLADALRGSQDGAASPVIEGRATPLAVLFGLVASVAFLQGGGPARVVAALVAPPSPDVAAATARALVDGVGLAVAIAAPLVAAAVVAEVAAAFVARAATPAQVHALLAPVRALVVLAVAGLVLDPVARVIAAAALGGGHSPMR